MLQKRIVTDGDDIVLGKDLRMGPFVGKRGKNIGP